MADLTYKDLSIAIERAFGEGEGYASLFEIARIEYSLGLFERSIQTWKRCLAFDRNVEALYGQGLSFFAKGAVSQALSSFLACLDLDKNRANALASVALCHIRSRNYPEALYFIGSALAIEPEDKNSLLIRARSALETEDLALAYDDCTKLLGTGFKSNEVALILAEIESKNGQHEIALYAIAEICQHYPESVTALLVFRKCFTRFFDQADPKRLQDFFESLALPISITPIPEIKPAKNKIGPKIDVIIPVFNAIEETLLCINSVLLNSGRLLGDIIIVDDYSSIETQSALAELAREHVNIRLVRNQQNLGFTRSVCAGIALSESAHFAVLNSDAIVQMDWLKRLLTSILSAPNAAMAGPLSNSAAWQNFSLALDENLGFQSWPIPDPQGQRSLFVGSCLLQDEASISTPILHGFCTLMNRAAYDAVGGFNIADFPQGYGETQDLSLRFISQGYSLHIAADCIVFHKRAASIGNFMRQTLSAKARQKLYDNFGAMGYLCAEMAACLNPQMMPVREHYASFEQ